MSAFSTRKIKNEYSFCRNRSHGCVPSRSVDPRGVPKTVLVEAHSLFEAAAHGFEKLYHDGGCRCDALHVTVHEPGATFEVRAGQLGRVAWPPRERETIGVTALKRRVQELLRAPGERTTEGREKKGERR